jgi:hypothetical protein
MGQDLSNAAKDGVAGQLLLLLLLGALFWAEDFDCVDGAAGRHASGFT